ncbi:hypothetical protein KAU40_01225 [Candidatus Parcubacteria bacterium]|nr:hypothetical protein [Candidatus Parcubacteria bacterium]
MTKKIRSILFLICLSLFLIIAPSIIFYSQGYRFDFETKKITQTGGLFLNILPKQSEIYLDGKLVKKTDFFFGSAFIENLLPRKYNVRVKKQGFFPWNKDLEIKEKQVTDAKNIILFPENPKLNLLTKGVENFWFSPNGKKIILKENEENTWALKLYDLDKMIKSHLIEETDIFAKGVELLNLEFSQDSKEIYLNVGMKEQEKNFILKINEVQPILTESELVKPDFTELIASEIFINNNYYLDISGNLYKNETKLSEKPFPIKKETGYTLKVFQNFLFLQENEILYLFDQDAKSFDKFFEKTLNLKISPCLQKIVYFSDSEIWLLSDDEKIFLFRLSEKIRNCFWLNSDYLIFSTENSVKITEIDKRDRLNIVEISKSENPKMFWNEYDKKLYVLKENSLYQSCNLLP